MLDARIFELNGLISFLKLAASSIVLVCVDWWAFEAQLIVSGLLGVQTQAAMIVLVNVMGQFAKIGQGLD